MIQFNDLSINHKLIKTLNLIDSHLNRLLKCVLTYFLKTFHEKITFRVKHDMVPNCSIKIEEKRNLGFTVFLLVTNHPTFLINKNLLGPLLVLTKNVQA